MLARDPDAFAARFERAGLHREQGAYEAAKADYLELLRRRPTDFGALNDFGNLVLKAGYQDAARSLFGEAVRGPLLNIPRGTNAPGKARHQ
jgi:Tfp pilus assembly protein PilF